MIRVLTYFMYWFTIIPWSYFLKNYLSPKYKYTFLYSSATFAIFTMMILVFFFENIAMKPFMTFFATYTCVWLFYDGARSKKLITPIILIAASSLSEVPVDIVLFKILNVGLDDVYKSANFLICQVVANINMMLICYIFVIISKRRINNTKKYPTLLIVISINFFCISTCISQLQVMHMINIPFSQRLHLGGIILILLLCTDVYFIFFFKEKYHNLKVRMSMKKIEQEYLSVLNEYCDRNDKMFRYVRHDIMNQILRYNESRDNENEDKKDFR